MLHGLTDADYQEALAEAREAGDEQLVAILHATEDIVSNFEFAHMRSFPQLKSALEDAQRRVYFLEIFLKSEGYLK